MTDTGNPEATHYSKADSTVTPCGVNLATDAYTYGSPLWADVDCPKCLASKPATTTTTTRSTSQDRTVENMIAAAVNIETQIEELRKNHAIRGGSATAEDALRLVRTIRKTYETLLPQ